MKKNLLLGIIMLGTALISTAQITINRSDYGNFVGATIIQANDTTNLNLLSPGNAGDNQTWDLTGIGNDKPDTMRFFNPAGMPCSESFPTATLAFANNMLLQGGTFYIYDNDTVFEMLGFCGVIFPPDTTISQFTPPQKQATFPFTYNTSFSGQTKQIIQFPETNQGPPDSIRVIQTLNYYSLIDGWGDVTTPAGTYSSLRQKYTKNTIDSTYVLINGIWYIGGPRQLDTTIEYSWWSQNNLFIATIETNGSGNIKKAKYLLSSDVGVNEIQDISLASLVFPNPSDGKFTVAVGNGSINTIEIYNMMGTKVLSASGTKRQTSYEINLSGFPKGIYLVKINNGENFRTDKIIIQ